MNVGELFVRMAVDSKQYEKDLGRLEGITQKKASTLGGVFKNAFSFTIGMGMFQAIQRGFQSVVGETINFNSMMEQAQIGFTTMLGSAERAQAFLDQMADFAAKTPFEFPDLLDAAKRMLAMGFAAGDVLPTMEAVGNAAAGLGLGRDGINRITLALGQMQAKAKVSGEEMRQLTEAGVPAWDMLAEAMEKSTAEVMKLSERGLIPADKAIQIITEGMNKRFPDMMKNMENTWQGVTSTIKDVWRMTMGALTSGLFKNLTTWLQGVRDWATDFYNTFQQFGLDAALTQAFGSGFADAVNLATAILQGFWTVLTYVTGLLRQHWQLIKSAGTAMLIYAAATKIAAGVTGAYHAISLALSGSLAAQSGLLWFLSNIIVYYKVQMLSASATTNVFTGALVRLRAALIAVHTALGPIGWALIGLFLLVGGGISLWNKYNQTLQKTPGISSGIADINRELADAASDATKGFDDQAKAINKAGKAANKNLQGFDEINALQSDMTGVGAGALELPGLEAIDTNIPDFGDLTGGMIEDMDDALNAGLPPLGERIKGFFSWIWSEVKIKWGGFIDYLLDSEKPIGTIALVIGALAASFGLVNIALGIWNAVGLVATGVTAAFGTALSFILSPIGLIILAIAAAIAIGVLLYKNWDTIKAFAIEIWGSIKTFFENTLNSVKSTVVTVWNSIKEFFVNLWNGIKSTASNIFNTIKNSIINAFNAVKSSVVNIWNGIKSTVTGVWNSIKSTAGSVFNTIKNSIINAFNAVKSRMSGIWSNIWGTIKGFINKIISGVNSMIRGLNKLKFSAPNWVPVIGGRSFGISIPTIPYLATGGYITAPTFAVLGEDYKREAVLPLDRNTGWADLIAERLASAMQSMLPSAGGASSDGPIVIYLTVDRTVLGKITARSLQELQRQSGKSVIPV